ncbi:MAG TPA: Imm1 family immunity protein [Leptolyngbyaceae cyanobacterium]
MFVSKLYTDKWTGNKNEDMVIENPNWQQIKTAICELDGNSKTLVSLEADEQSYMMIGGGNDGQYIVTATLDNETFYSLLHSNAHKISRSYISVRKIRLSRFSQALINAKNKNTNSANEQKLVVGGQAGNYSKKICVDLSQCLIAAKRFAESGELDPLFTWQEDESLVTV